MIHIEELAAHQSDALGAFLHGIHGIGRRTDISADTALDAVGRTALPSTVLLQIRDDARKLLPLAQERLPLRLTRREDEASRLAVHNRTRAVLDRVEVELQPADRRYPEIASDDAGVGIVAAGLRCDASDMAQIQADRVRRCQLCGDEDRILRQCVEVHTLLLEDVQQQPLTDVLDIRRPLGKILIIRLCKHRRDFRKHAVRRMRGVAALIPNFFENRLHHGIFILQKCQLRVQYLRLPRTVRRLCALQKRLRLLHSGGVRRTETRLFCLKLLRNKIRNHQSFLSHDRNMPHRYARGDCFSLIYRHLFHILILPGRFRPPGQWQRALLPRALRRRSPRSSYHT